MEKKNSQDLTALISEQFSNYALPVLNGFIIYIHRVRNTKASLAETTKYLCQYDYIESNTLTTAIKKIDDQLQKFKKGVDRNWFKVIDFLHREFEVQPKDCINIMKLDQLKKSKCRDVTSSSVNSDSSQPGLSLASSIESAITEPKDKNRSTLGSLFDLKDSGDLTTHGAQLQRRLSYMSLARRNERRKYRETLNSYKNSIKSLHPSVKSLQQTIKRKNERITFLEEKLKTAIASSAKEDSDNCAKMTKMYKEEQLKSHLKKKAEQRSSFITQLAERDTVTQKLQQESLLLQTKINQMESLLRSDELDRTIGHEDVRLMILDCIENKVPTACIPSLINSFTSRLGVNIDLVPQQNSVEQMVKDLVLIADVQTDGALQMVEIFVTTENIP